MKKKQRVSTVTPARPTMTASVHRSVPPDLMRPSLRRAPSAFQAGGHGHRDAIATTMLSLSERVHSDRAGARQRRRHQPKRRVRRAQNAHQAQHARKARPQDVGMKLARMMPTTPMPIQLAQVTP